MSKIISTFKIGFDDETKAEIAALKSLLDAIKATLGVPSALLGSTKPNSGLLVAMAGDAANDMPEPELLELGQWVFEGQPKEFVTAHVNSFGAAAISSMPFGEIEPGAEAWAVKQDAQVTTPTCLYRELKGKFDTTNWQISAISRQPVNDVDYLSDSLPSLDDVLSRHDVTSESVLPQITQADMQLIFIKNLSEVLIQRMHSMNRFSEDDYAIGGDKLMAWDIVANPKGDFAVITGHNQDKRYFGVLYFVPYARGNHAKTVSGHRANEYLKTLEFCTITEDQLSAFRATLEACYA